MKVQFHDYEIQISAKSIYSTKGSKLDTFYLLNYIAFAMSMASHWEKQIECNAIAEEMKINADNLTEQLKNKGFYKTEKIKENEK